MWGSPTGRPIRARYVVGCDGARSATRGRIGSALHDTGFEESWLVVDLLLAADVPGLPTRCLQVCDPARPHTLVPMPAPALPLRVHAAAGGVRGGPPPRRRHRRPDVLVDRPRPRHGGAVGGLHVPRPGGRGLAGPADLPGRRRRPPDPAVPRPGHVRGATRRRQPGLEAGGRARRLRPRPPCSTAISWSGSPTPGR